MTAEEIVVLIVLIIIIALASFLYGLKSGKQEGKEELMKDLVYIWKNMPEFLNEPRKEEKLCPPHWIFKDGRFMKGWDKLDDGKREEAGAGPGDESV